MALVLPEGAIPLAVGTVLALGGLSLVLLPLIGEDVSPSDKETSSTRARTERDAAVNLSINGAVAALREIEFDRETGKLSDTDYALLKQRYTQAAVDEMRAAKSASTKFAARTERGVAKRAHVEATRSGQSPDPVEAAIERARAQQQACDVCGPRPEPDAAYCSSCGRYLAKCCADCGASVELVGSRFCSNCGEQLVLV